MQPVPDAERTIRGWFERVGQADLKLPDRYFDGRPYEGLHELTFLTTRPRKLLVELDERLLLVFTGIPAVKERKLEHAVELVLSGFNALTFDWQGYSGAETPHVERYPDGQVTFGFLGRPGEE